VGDDAAGAADPFGEFCLYARDFNNAPIPNVTVVIDFSGCDLQLCANPLDPDAIVDCVSMTVRKVANAQGVACFRVRGKSRWPQPDCSAPAANCAVVFADGVFICSLDAPTFDLVSQSGEDGLNPNDIAEWLRLAFNCPEGPYRGNYDCTNRGVLDPNDLAVFLRVHFAGGSASNCTGAKCP
jgi:hypothetical protein